MAKKQPATNFSRTQQQDIDRNNNALAAAEQTKKDNIQSMKDKEGVQYTMIVSGLRNGRASELEGKNNTTDIAILFDSVVNHTYTKAYNKTSYAVESRVKISDHITTNDGKFSFTGRITDSPYLIDQRNYIDRDTSTDRPKDSKRPSKAVDILERIADSHQLITLVTEDNILTGYSITNFSVARSTQDGASVVVNIDLEEFRFRTVGKTIFARADPKKAGNVNKGAKQTAEGGAADNANKGRRSPYIAKTRENFEQLETERMGTTDFSGKPGAKITPTSGNFNPSSLMR